MAVWLTFKAVGPRSPDVEKGVRLALRLEEG
jgi:hypothetical protein